MVKTRPGGRGRALSRLRARHVQPRTRAINARAAVTVGTEKFLMSHTRNTNVWAELQDPAASVRAPSPKPQAASVKPEDLHAANTENFISLAERKNPKVQAPSSKPQASSRKRQAP